LRHAERKAGLEALLLRFQHLWRPQPFKIETPDWCAEYPALTAELLALDDATVDRLSADNAALIALLARHVPELGELAALIELPTLSHRPEPPSSQKAEAIQSPSPSRWEELERGREPAPRSPPRLFTDIPGRKQAQIEAYAAALNEPCAPLLEWCAGKGHLGRLLAARWRRPVASLEIDAALCEAGADLARRARLDDVQHFIQADALAADSARYITGRHAVALHACGDLHTRLVAEAAAHSMPALDIAPCCYYRTVHDSYRPFNDTGLTLGRDDLRLAVTETATASASQRRQSRRALAWKLGWVELRKTLTGEADYRTFPPVPEAWLRGTFEEFVEKMRRRASLDLHAHLPSPPAPPPAGEGCAAARERETLWDIHRLEALGHARADRMLRLQLVRLAFRRPLEVWLLMDMATFLEDHGYRVAVGPFCDAALTPRNLLLSARH
jgi:hypothetical protein